MINVKSKLMRKGLVVVILPLVLELLFMGILVYFMVMAESDIQRRIESKKIVASATAIVARIIDAQLIALTYNAQKIPMLDVRFDEDQRLVNNQMLELKRMCEQSEPRRSMSLKIEESVNATFDRLRRVFTGEFQDNANLKEIAGTGKQSSRIYNRMTGAFTEIDKLLAAEQRMQAQSQAREKLYKNYLREAIIWGVSLNVIVTVLLAIYFAKTFTTRLSIILANTERMRNREALAQPIGGNDELSNLDAVFHKTFEDLITVDEQRKHLVSLVRDELSTPLRRVQYTLHNLLQGVMGELTPKAENRFMLAARDTDRVVRLIDDLLSIETMEGARFELELESVASNEIIEMAAGSVKDMAERHGVKLEIKDARARFVADRDRLVQVLINFLSNAVKFSPRGASVTIQVIDGGDDVEFRVIDRGRGVPGDKVEQIFEPFQQVEDADQTTKGGTGLGLPISKTIVEQHGGAIGVTSKLGEGSTFWFKLPKQN